MTLTLVNRSDKYPPARLIAPAPYGYIHIAAAVAPPAGRTPFTGRSAARAALLGRLTALVRDLETRQDVVKVTVYRAAVMPPAPFGAPPGTRHPIPHDVVVLVETATPDAITGVRDAEAYGRIIDAIAAGAREHRVTTATCAKRIGDVDKTRPGLFLFNYFVTEDVPTALDLWDHLAGWYLAETGLDNSTVLVPDGDADFAFVNHARWDIGIPRFAARQFGTPSFRSYVLANLRANRTASMPALFRLA